MPRRPIDITVPDLTGSRAVVTGASDGIGLGIAGAARRGRRRGGPARAQPRKGEAAIAEIRRRTPDADVSLRDARPLVARVGRGARRRSATGGPADPPPHQQRRRHDAARAADHADGFELQLGTNHLGHVALVAHLLPLLRAGPRAGHLAGQRRGEPGRHQLGRPELGARPTTACAPTASRRSPSGCSASSSTGAAGPPAGASRATSPTRASPRRACSPPGPSSAAPSRPAAAGSSSPSRVAASCVGTVGDRSPASAVCRDVG